MIDTLMALWNRGYGGRGILVIIAFSLICISISLLLVSAGSSWFSSGGRRLPGKHISIISAGDLTATAQSNNIRPVPDNTVTIYSPTATVTAIPCSSTTFVVSKTPLVQANATRYRGSGHYRPTPTPPHSRTTPTPVKATPTPGSNADGDSTADTDSYSNEDSNADADSEADRDANTNGDSNNDADGDSNTQSNTQCDGDNFNKSDRYRNGDNSPSS